MQRQVSLIVNLNTKIRFVGIKSNLPDYPIIFFLCLWRRFFFLPQTRMSKRRLEKWEHWNFGTNCFPSQVLLQRPAVAAALSCAVVKYSVSIWKFEIKLELSIENQFKEFKLSRTKLSLSIGFARYILRMKRVYVFTHVIPAVKRWKKILIGFMKTNFVFTKIF